MKKIMLGIILGMFLISLGSAFINWSDGLIEYWDFDSSPNGTIGLYNFSGDFNQVSGLSGNAVFFGSGDLLTVAPFRLWWTPRVPFTICVILKSTTRLAMARASFLCRPYCSHIRSSIAPRAMIVASFRSSCKPNVSHPIGVSARGTDSATSPLR